MECNDHKHGSVIMIAIQVVLLLMITAFVTYMVWNPRKSAADTRNQNREQDIQFLMNEVTGYTKLHGNIPSVIPINSECASYGNEICKKASDNCDHMVNLSFLTVDIPFDTEKVGSNGTGYFISQDGQGNILVCAPYAERNVKITLSKFAF